MWQPLKVRTSSSDSVSEMRTHRLIPWQSTHEKHEQTQAYGEVGRVTAFSKSIEGDKVLLAERELASFLRAVTLLFGTEQASLSAQDWLNESERLEGHVDRGERDWRSVTIAASVRLAERTHRSLPGEAISAA